MWSLEEEGEMRTYKSTEDTSIISYLKESLTEHGLEVPFYIEEYIQFCKLSGVSLESSYLLKLGATDEVREWVAQEKNKLAFIKRWTDEQYY